RKNPATAPTPPTTRVDSGTAALRRRPGTTYFTMAPTSRNAAATPNVDQDSAVPSSEAQTKMPRATRSVPGSTGTTMPNSPTTTRSPLMNTVPVMLGSLPHALGAGGRG